MFLLPVIYIYFEEKNQIDLRREALGCGEEEAGEERVERAGVVLALRSLDKQIKINKHSQIGEKSFVFVTVLTVAHLISELSKVQPI